MSPPLNYKEVFCFSNLNLKLPFLLEDSNGLDYGVEVIQA